MHKLKKESLLDSEREYVCLICETQFMQFESKTPVCPKCGAKGPDAIVEAKEMELEEEYNNQTR